MQHHFAIRLSDGYVHFLATSVLGPKYDLAVTRRGPTGHTATFTVVKVTKCRPTNVRARYPFTLLSVETCRRQRYALTTSMVLSLVSSTVTATIGKAFFIALAAVIAGSLSLNDRLSCPSTRNRNRSSMSRACPFGFSAAGCSGFVNVGRACIASSRKVARSQLSIAWIKLAGVSTLPTPSANQGAKVPDNGVRGCLTGLTFLRREPRAGA